MVGGTAGERGIGRLLSEDRCTRRPPCGGDRAGDADLRSGTAAGRPVTRALVLAAHGSRREPAANALVRRLAETLRGHRLFDEVAVAFHQGEPGFHTVLDEIAA